MLEQTGIRIRFQLTRFGQYRRQASRQASTYRQTIILGTILELEALH